MATKNHNNIVIGLTCFCSSCTLELRPANCDDMNGDLAHCKKCGITKIQIGISIHSNSAENMRNCYEQMKTHRGLIKKLLAERNPSEQ
jgi:hypothetical protein